MFMHNKGKVGLLPVPNVAAVLMRLLKTASRVKRRFDPIARAVLRPNGPKGLSPQNGCLSSLSRGGLLRFYS